MITMTFMFSGTTPKDNYNRPLYGFHGQYTLSPGISLPYFLASMPIERVIDELKIAEQISPSINNRWSLNELFQREVDRNRVARDLVRGYLADPHKLKFFNALTIVLMPKAVEGTGSEKFESEAVDSPAIPWDGSDPEDAAWAKVMTNVRATFGGVQYIIVGSQARLRWDLDRVLAVAVDGQHRLVALQEYRDEYRQKTLAPEEKKTTVPVLFLLISPQAGYRNEKQSTLKGIRAIARELFTDLNKNAKTVDSARQLVLDDWDLTARCVRELITDEAARDSKVILPLTLVRWQDAINRFDTSFYLNSLVHLQMLVEDVLNLPPLKSMDGAGVRDYIKRVGAVLGDGGALVDPETNRTLLDVYDKDYCDPEGEPQTPFMRLPTTYLEYAIQGFRKHHRSWIIRLLTEFAPYKQLLAYARKHNLIEGEFGKWHAQTKKHRELLKSEFNAKDANWYTREILKHIEHIEQLKGDKDDADWSFKAIFQKAIVRLARSVVFESAGDADRLGTLDTLLAVFDALHAKGVLRVRAPLKGHSFGLWAFIGINPGNQKIKVTAKVEDNIFSLLRLWYYANRKVALDLASTDTSALVTVTTPVDARKLLAFFEMKKNIPQWPGADDCIDKLRIVLASPVLFKAENLQDAAESAEEQERLKSDREEIVMRRLSAVLEAGLVTEPSAQPLTVTSTVVT
jgi:hypothetical protein